VRHRSWPENASTNAIQMPGTAATSGVERLSATIIASSLALATLTAYRSETAPPQNR